MLLRNLLCIIRKLTLKIWWAGPLRDSSLYITMLNSSTQKTSKIQLGIYHNDDKTLQRTVVCPCLAITSLHVRSVNQSINQPLIEIVCGWELSRLDQNRNMYETKSKKVLVRYLADLCRVMLSLWVWRQICSCFCMEKNKLSESTSTGMWSFSFESYQIQMKATSCQWLILKKKSSESFSCRFLQC